jgi:hypothetical protein
MMRSTHSPIRSFGLCLLLMICVLSAALGQSTNRNNKPAASSTGKFRIAGKLVNGVTDEPIVRGTVSLLAESDSHTIATTLTDSEGRFSIEGLDADKYQLTAAKRGYRTTFFDEHEEYSSAIVTGSKTGSEAYINVEQLSFRMTPGAMIHGVVLADTGDPVEDATVRLYQRNRDHGVGPRITAPTSEKTDDTGSYEFGNLAPGDYMLAVTAVPWYAQARSIKSFSIDGNGEADNGLDVTYPVTYYDSTTDESSASTLNLTGGNRVEANITLHAVPALHITLPLAQGNDSDQDVDSSPQLTQLIFGAPAENEILVPSGGRSRSPSEFTGISPGLYTLEEGNPPRTVTVDVQNSQQIDASSGQESITVSGTLYSASDKPLSDPLNLALEETGSSQPVEPMRTVSVKGHFFINDVPPGHWTLWAADGDKTLATAAITINGKSIAGGDFNVKDKSINLDVTLAQDLVRIDGVVLKNGKGFPGAMVVLLPQNPAALHALLRRDQSDSDGTFSLRDVAPGRYTIIAIEGGWSLDWAKPGVLDRYLSGGLSVTLRSTQSNELRLDQPIQLQQR